MLKRWLWYLYASIIKRICILHIRYIYIYTYCGPVHIHARSKAVQSAVAQSTVQPRPALLNSGLEQQSRAASLSALAALKQARTDFSSALAAPERARAAVLSSLASPQRARAAFSSALAAPGQAGAAILSALVAPKQARTALQSAPAAPGQARAAILSAKVAPVR